MLVIMDLEEGEFILHIVLRLCYLCHVPNRTTKVHLVCDQHKSGAEVLAPGIFQNSQYVSI